MKSKVIRLLGGIIVLVGVVPMTLQAQVDTHWTNASSGYWSDGASWDNGVPSTGRLYRLDQQCYKQSSDHQCRHAKVNLTITNLTIYSPGNATDTNTLYLLWHQYAVDPLGAIDFGRWGWCGSSGGEWWSTHDDE